MLAQSACDALFSETVGTEFFCPPCEFFALVFQSQQKFQATITKKLSDYFCTHFVCEHMLVQSACDAIFSETVGTEFFLCPCDFVWFFCTSVSESKKYSSHDYKKTDVLPKYTLRVRTHVGTKRLWRDFQPKSSAQLFFMPVWIFCTSVSESTEISSHDYKKTDGVS